MRSAKLNKNNKILPIFLAHFIFLAGTTASASELKTITPPQQQNIIPSISEIPPVPSIKLPVALRHKDIFQFDKTPAAFSPRRSSNVMFYEDASNIILTSAYYKLAIDKKNGGIKYIEDLKAGDSFGVEIRNHWQHFQIRG